MTLHEACKDCDGSCLGSSTCAPEGYAYVCRACQVEGCLLTKEEWKNLSERCRKNRKEAEERLIEFERVVFGD